MSIVLSKLSRLLTSVVAISSYICKTIIEYRRASIYVAMYISKTKVTKVEWSYLLNPMLRLSFFLLRLKKPFT